MKKLGTQPIETERVFLKKANIQDSPLAYKNFFCEEKSAKYMFWKVPKSIEETEVKIKNWINEFGDDVFYFIYLKENDEPIGFLSGVNLDDTTFGELGICLGTNYVGKGLGTEIMIGFINYLKSNGIKLIKYSAFSENIASINLAKKLGFQFIESKNTFVKKYNSSMKEDCYELKL